MEEISKIAFAFFPTFFAQGLFKESSLNQKSLSIGHIELRGDEKSLFVDIKVAMMMGKTAVFILGISGTHINIDAGHHPLQFCKIIGPQ